MLKVGLLVNPLAGIGGALAHKGSDDAALRASAMAAGAKGRGPARALRALRELTASGDARAQIAWYCWGSDMGEDTLLALGLPCVVLGQPEGASGAPDTITAARAMRDAGVDLLLFCGGDGTARDVLAAVDQSIPVLGIPAGVKMHSGVFATTPESAGAILVALAAGGLVRSALADVRDLDEAALRQGVVRPQFYGELKVPEFGGFLQHTKESGRENEALALEEIVAEVIERIRQRDGVYILGPGSTLAAIKQALGMQPTLIGIDVLESGRQVGRDVDAGWLEALLGARAAADLPRGILVLSFTRQQGFLLGRGNLQLTPTVLRLIGRDGLWIAGSRSKLLSLAGRPLLIDTDDPALDRAWSGLYEIITGYEDRLWYRVETGAAGA